MSTSGLLVDTDVLSWIAFARPEAKPFEPLLLDRLPFVSEVNCEGLAEVRTESVYGEVNVALRVSGWSRWGEGPVRVRA